MATSVGPKAVGTGLEQRLVEGFQYELDRALHHFIFGGREAQRTQLAVAFRNEHAAYWLRLIGASTELLGQMLEPFGIQTPPFDAVHPRGIEALVGANGGNGGV
jgi:hypothetical protein